MHTVDKTYEISIDTSNLKDSTIRTFNHPEYKHAKIEIITKNTQEIIQKIYNQINANLHIANRK